MNALCFDKRFDVTSHARRNVTAPLIHRIIRGTLKSNATYLTSPIPVEHMDVGSIIWIVEVRPNRIASVARKRLRSPALMAIRVNLRHRIVVSVFVKIDGLWVEKRSWTTFVPLGR